MNVAASSDSGLLSLVPDDLEACRRMLRVHPDAQLLAGATAAQASWPTTDTPAAAVNLWSLMQQARSQPLRRIERLNHKDHLVLPALRTLESLRCEPLFMASFPELVGLISQIGSAAVRRLGTLGGNLCWPSGDLAAAMLVLDATYVFLNRGAIPAAAAPLLPRNDLLTAVRLPLAEQRRLVVIEKVGFRAAFSPSLVTLAICVVERAADRSSVPSIRLAVGGGTTWAQRLSRTEALLRSNPEVGRQQVVEQIRAEMISHDDTLASADERVEVAARCIAGHLENADVFRPRALGK